MTTQQRTPSDQSGSTRAEPRPGEGRDEVIEREAERVTPRREVAPESRTTFRARRRFQYLGWWYAPSNCVEGCRGGATGPSFINFEKSQPIAKPTPTQRPKMYRLYKQQGCRCELSVQSKKYAGDILVIAPGDPLVDHFVSYGKVVYDPAVPSAEKLMADGTDRFTPQHFLNTLEPWREGAQDVRET